MGINYNKSFNFRNGVQVDNDNFVVNPNGLVGIGTTIPEGYLLNVYGDTRVTGLVTAGNLNTLNLYSTGIATVGFLTATNIQVSGAITATTFYGSAAGLTGIYAIAVDGWYVSAGNISTTSKVGIGTTLPTGNFQVGVGVTINSNGNATYAGIVTASSFIGSGNNITTINASNISSGTLSNSRLPSNINLSGIITGYSFSGFGTDISGINASNISSGTLNNARLPSNISVGTVTATTFTGNLTGTATTATSLSGNPNIAVTNINANGIITATTLGVSGLTTTTNLVAQTSIGIGTNNPIGNFQIRNATAASILVTSDTQSALISIGRSNSLESSNGVLRFGNTSGLFPYSDQNSLDILNYSTGNLNFYLEAGTPGVGTGNFYWHRRKNFARLMTLTYGGNLGVGITTPSNTLHVVGTSTVTSNAYFGNNVEITGNLTVSGSLSANITSNVNITSGISTFNNVSISATTTTSSLRVSTSGLEKNINTVQVNSGVNAFCISGGSIGIKTDTIQYSEVDLDCTRANISAQAIGVGTTSYRSVVDFADAGKNVLGGVGAFMIPPRITTAQRTGLATAAGAIIYNIDINTHQGYNGSTWNNFY